MSDDSKILFYTHTARAFRSTLIGHLYELAQVYRVVLLSEKLDPETEGIIRDRSRFPRIEAIVPVDQFSPSGRGLLADNRRLCRLARQAVEGHRPDVVIAASDMHSLFEMYLLRFAKQSGAVNICIQPTLMVENRRSAIWVELMNIQTFRPAFLPTSLKRIMIRGRKYLGHLFLHGFLPLLAGQAPLRGESSYVLRKGNSGLRDADGQLVFSSWDAEMFQRDDVPGEKLFILPHPLQRETRSFMMGLTGEASSCTPRERSALLLFPAEEVGFTSDGYRLISRERRWEGVTAIVRTVADLLDSWEIIVKPHPDTRGIERIRAAFAAISPRISVIHPADPVDPYIGRCDVVIELPRAASTATFTASLQCPGKPIFALDFDHEFLGDVHKHTHGVEYLDDRDRFIEALTRVRNGCYQKRPAGPGRSADREFGSTVEAIVKLSGKGET